MNAIDRLRLGLCLALAVAGEVSATNLVEFFNGYGTETVNIVGLGTAADGWGGAWTPSHPNNATYSHPSDYVPGTQLSWEGARFSADGNLDNEESGCFRGLVNNAAVIAYRRFASPLSGTVWISAITKPIGFSQTWMNLFLGSASSNPAIGLEAAWQPSQGIAPKVKTNAITWNLDGKPGHVYAQDTVILLLIRVDYNVDGSNDRVRVWTNPELDRLEPISAPAYDFGEADHVGSSLSVVGLSASSTFLVDALRISDGDGDAAKGYCFVTGQPDPPTPETIVLIR